MSDRRTSTIIQNPWTNVYGLARTLMALGLLSTLLFSSVDDLFATPTFRAISETIPVTRFGLFYLMSGSHESLELARWLSIAILVVIASGWMPRFTGILHWWLSFSFAVGTSVVEGGDQINANLTLLLLPVTIMDSRRWHWSNWTPELLSAGEQIRAVIAESCMLIIRLQVAAIYFNAAVGKLGVREWVDGTALYYWFMHPVFGMNGAIQTLILPIITNPWGVTLLTWGVIAFETLLASALVMQRRHYQRLLLPGIVFHFAIVVAHGLFNFFFAMAGALVLYLRPSDRPFTWSIGHRFSAIRRQRKGYPDLGRAGNVPVGSG